MTNNGTNIRNHYASREFGRSGNRTNNEELYADNNVGALPLVLAGAINYMYIHIWHGKDKGILYKPLSSSESDV